MLSNSYEKEYAFNFKKGKRMNLKKTEGISKVVTKYKTNQDSAQPPFVEDPKAETAKEKYAESPPDRVVVETGGPKGLEPTRYGDWEQKGRCTDF